jgi:hypothetical protein
MELTSLQRRVLQLYAAWREHPPTVAGLFILNWRRYLLMGVLLGAVAWWFDYWGMSGLVYWTIGVLFGALVRDLGIFFRTVRLWLLEAEVLNWQRVEELSAQPGPSS